ncbi:MAG: Hsp20 family protein, partial [Erysipelotrichaceae bacterium]|nr:Hsp20 family protein [Erysipelotrichaceae bacterium]
EEKKDGKIIRQERYSGMMSRSFYVGDEITSDEIQGKYEGGVLTLHVPKKEDKEVEHQNRIMIE